MPIFDFHCESCHHEFEKLVMKRDQQVPCPQCGSGVRKLPSRFAIRGTGSDGSGSGAGSNCSGCTASSCTSCAGG